MVDAAAGDDGKLVKPLGNDLGLDRLFLGVISHCRIIAKNRPPPSSHFPMQKRFCNNNFFLAT